MLFLNDHSVQSVRKGLEPIASVRGATTEELRRKIKFTDDRGVLLCVTPIQGMEADFEKWVYKTLCIDDPHGIPDISIPSELNTPEWNTQIETWDTGKSNLIGAVREFRWANPDLEKPNFARGSCWVASHRFLIFCIRRSVITSDMYTRGKCWIDSWENEEHWYFRLSNIVIDWTYRQFDPNCPFPFIWRAKPMQHAS